MSDDSYHDEVRIDSIVELTEALVKESVTLSKKHGLTDPRMDVVLSSAYVSAIQKLSSICPTLPFMVASMLTENLTKGKK